VKRALAYMVTGIVLGIATMFIPLIVFIPSNVYLSGGTLVDSALIIVDSARKLGVEEYAAAKAPAEPSETERTLGVGGIGVGISFPSSLLYVGLIFAVSLVSALGVYGLLKRRLIS